VRTIFWWLFVRGRPGAESPSVRCVILALTRSDIGLVGGGSFEVARGPNRRAFAAPSWFSRARILAWLVVVRSGSPGGRFAERSLRHPGFAHSCILALAILAPLECKAGSFGPRATPHSLTRSVTQSLTHLVFGREVEVSTVVWR
jgi:hypothetical protein